MKYMLSFAVAALVSTSAHAEAFNGAYGLVQGGLESNKINSSELFVGSTLGVPTVSASKASNAVIGVAIGYDGKIGSKLVIGGEFGGMFSTGSNNQTILFPAPNSKPVNINYKSQALYDVTLRAGVLVGENTLVYARGGYANSKLKATITSLNTVNVVKGNNNGYVLGGGIEHNFGGKFAARAEYRYINLKGPISRNQFLAGLVYRF